MTSDNKLVITDVLFTKARDLIEYFLDSKNIFAPKHIFDVSEKYTSGYIYRGQAKKEWTLLPTAHREGNPLKGFTPQPPFKGLLKTNEIREYVWSHIHAELRAVMLFLEAADHVGIQTPLDYNHIAAHQYLFDELRNDEFSVESLDFRHPTYRPSVALAQHYGVPTRLLDWTESPLIAAYFAAEGASALERSEHNNEDFSVICLNTVLFSKIQSISTVPTARASNAFLRAQRGTFTVINNASQYFLENQRWPSIEDILKEKWPSETYFIKLPFIRISLPISQANELLRLLYTLNISKLTLMPSLHTAAENFANKQLLWPDSE